MRRKISHRGLVTVTKSIKITLQPGGEEFFIDDGTTLLDALLQMGKILHTACGGQGTCGKCLVKARGTISNPDERERHHLTQTELEQGYRLACWTILSGDAVVDFPESPLPPSDSSHFPSVSENFIARQLSAIVDIGTTSIKIAVIDLTTGKRIGSDSVLNPQRIFGHDVMSRLQMAKQRLKFQEMVKTLRVSISRLILSVLKKIAASPRDIVRIVISGNTVMLHFFFGMEVGGLGKYPYTPESLEAITGKAKDYGLNDFEFSELIGLPAISAYLGGDVVAGLLTSGIYREPANILFLDIGTNSEIILCSHGRLLGTSCAAGPALEGMNIEYGMIASQGAITGVRINNDVELTVIDETLPPLGLCGSGIIELMVELLRVQIVDNTGRMSSPQDSLPPAIKQKVRELRESKAFFITDEIYFSQKDIRQVQLAKGAIFSGIKTLQDRAGITSEEIAKVVIAGEFGQHLKIEHLSKLGILEPYPNATCSFMGNSSLQGASLIASSPQLLTEASLLAREVEAISLAMSSRYERLFIESLEFPSGQEHFVDTDGQTFAKPSSKENIPC